MYVYIYVCVQGNMKVTAPSNSSSTPQSGLFVRGDWTLKIYILLVLIPLIEYTQARNLWLLGKL